MEKLKMIVSSYDIVIKYMSNLFIHSIYKYDLCNSNHEEKNEKLHRWMDYFCGYDILVYHFAWTTVDLLRANHFFSNLSHLNIKRSQF